MLGTFRGRNPLAPAAAEDRLPGAFYELVRDGREARWGEPFTGRPAACSALKCDDLGQAPGFGDIGCAEAYGEKDSEPFVGFVVLV